VYVRLAGDWADQGGAVHAAGEFVDIDAITLAKLEEQGVVDSAGQPDGDEPQGEDWWGPGDGTTAADDGDAPDADEDTAE
jgi:hypothetical protein